MRESGRAGGRRSAARRAGLVVCCGSSVICSILTAYFFKISVFTRFKALLLVFYDGFIISEGILSIINDAPPAGGLKRIVDHSGTDLINFLNCQNIFVT